MDRPAHFHPIVAIGSYILTIGSGNYLALVYFESGVVDPEGVAMAIVVAFAALGAGAAVAPIFNSLRSGTLIALIAIASVAFNVAQLTSGATLWTVISGDLRWSAILIVIALAFIVCTSVAAKLCSDHYRRMLPKGSAWAIPIILIAVTAILKSLATASSSGLLQTATVQSSVTTALCAATMLLASFSALAATLIFQALAHEPLQKLISLIAIASSVAAALAAAIIVTITGLKLLAFDYFNFFYPVSVALERAAVEGGISLLTGSITLAGFWFLDRITRRPLTEA